MKIEISRFAMKNAHILRVLSDMKKNVLYVCREFIWLQNELLLEFFALTGRASHPLASETPAFCLKESACLNLGCPYDKLYILDTIIM